MNDQALPEAVERVLQQFEAMAGAADWSLDAQGGLATRSERDGYHACPLMWMAGLSFGIGGATSGSAEALGMDMDEAAFIYQAADNNDLAAEYVPAIRARLLAAAGLA